MPGHELLGQEEKQEVLDVFDNGGILFRQGFEGLRNNCYKVRQFENAFASHMNVPYALAVSSGTAALRVALAALGIGQGDEVITQSFTFVATVEAIIESRAIPICADIDTTLNMDPEDLERRITPNTKAVIVVHMLGTPARLPEIVDICRKYNLLLIEDTAWGCGGFLNDKPLGTWGSIGTFSFDFAKTITTGEGGMLVFRDKETYMRAQAWHDHGHESNPTVPRWEDTRASSGFNYRMTELQGAVGVAQLRKLKEVVLAQRNNKFKIWNAICDLPGVTPRSVPSGSYETSDALVFFVDTKERARLCRENLINAGLATKILPEAYTWHFSGTWHHMSELVSSHGGDLTTAFDKSHSILARAVSIPVNVNMAREVPSKVRDAITKAFSL